MCRLFIILAFFALVSVNASASEYNNAGYPSCERTREDPCQTAEQQIVFRDAICRESALQAGLDSNGSRTTFVSIEQYYVCKNRKRELQGETEKREYELRSEIATSEDSAYQRAVRSYNVNPGASKAAPPGYYFIPPSACDGQSMQEMTLWVLISPHGYNVQHWACSVGKEDQRNRAVFLNQSRQAVTIEAHPFFE